MTDILIPAAGDFNAWAADHETCIAVDWDGTCKDTMVTKWARGFNLAITDTWPQLKPHRATIDKVCHEVNLVDPSTAGVQRFVALKIMMGMWAEMGLPVPDLSAFFAAVDHVESTGEQHGVETYRKYQKQFGYDDAALRWSDRSDEHIAESSKDARIFEHVAETLRAAAQKADLVVVSASKTDAVLEDIRDHDMTALFVALCAQDFLPKMGIIAGLAKKYERVLFMGDTQHDIRAAAPAGVPVYLIRTGSEDDAWAAAGGVIDRFVAGETGLSELLYSRSP